MMISLLFHRYPSVPCQGCTVTNFRCLPAERDTTQPLSLPLMHLHQVPYPHTHLHKQFPSHHITSCRPVALAWLGMMQSKSIVQLTTHVDTNPSYDYDPLHKVNASQCNTHTAHNTPSP